MKLKPHFLTAIFCILSVSFVLLFYHHTLFYPVKAFDEITPFKELHMPVCYSISEIFELISLLGLNHHFEASNTLYSNIISIRSNPVGDFLVLLTQLICRKNPFKYHLYSLILHLLNTALIFLLINKISIDFNKANNISAFARLGIVSLFSILWATHPVNIESVLLLTNYNSILCNTISIIILYIYINHINKNQKMSFIQSLLLSAVYLIALFSAEYLFMLPIIIFSYFLAINLYHNHNAQIIKTIKLISPLLFGVFIFVILFLSSKTKINLTTRTLTIALERIFWISPQIFFHFLKLFLFPVKLSVDQTFFVKLDKELFGFYSIFCVLFLFLFLFVSFKSLLSANKKLPVLFITLFLFFLALFPFLHIISPIYNLASERYLYFASFMFVFGISHWIFYLFNKYKDNKKIIMPMLCLLVLLATIYSTRAGIRTLDWQDSFTLYYSAIKTSDNYLEKAFRYKLLLKQEKVFSRFPNEVVEKKYQILGIKNLKKALIILQDERKQYQTTIPEVIKYYGLDPDTLYAKAGYLLAHSDYILYDNPKSALKIIKKYVKDLSLLDSTSLAFYGSLYFFDKNLDEAEKLYRYAYKKFPYSIRVVFPFCQLLYVKYGDLTEVEKYILKSFEYYPYDSFTLLFLTKIYKLKGDLEKFAFFSYAYGLRHHSIEFLKTAYNVYSSLNKIDMQTRVKERINLLEKRLSKRG